MNFSDVIDKIMPEVRSGSNEPFIIYHDKDGNWHGDFTQNQYGESFDWVEGAKEQDPLALIHKGTDFAKGSFPNVYDTILTERIRQEYYIARSSGKDDDKLHALTCFFQDNVGEFSHEVTDYLVQFDRPLAALAQMCPFNLATDNEGWTYNGDLAWDAIDRIESIVNDRLQRIKDEPAPDKRSFDGYTEIVSIQVNGRLMFLGENPKAEHQYRVSEFKWDNPFGAMEDVFTGVTGDYLEALDKFKYLIEYNINVVKSEREVRDNLYGVKPIILTAEHCVPNGLNENLTGKLVIIKPEVLTPEFRYADHQLRIARGGFGTSTNSRGNAVFCKDLFIGKESRFERYDILGVADLEKLPKWVNERLSAIENGELEPTHKSKKTSLLGKLDDNKEKVERSKSERKDKTVPKKSGKLEVD